MGWKRTTAIALVAVFALDVFVGTLGTPDRFRPLYILSLIVEWLLIWPMAKLGGAFGALSTYAAIATTFGAILTFVWLAQRYVLAAPPVANTSKETKVD